MSADEGTDSALRALRALQRFVQDTRHANRWSQRQVAERAGLSKGTLSFLESPLNKSIPRQPTLIKLAKGLGVQYSVLDRIVRGGSPEPDALTVNTAALLDECSPEIRAMLLEYSTWPDHIRAAFEAGVHGLVEGLKRSQDQ